MQHTLPILYRAFSIAGLFATELTTSILHSEQ